MYPFQSKTMPVQFVAAQQFLRCSEGNNYRGDEREDCNCNYKRSFLSQQKESFSYDKVV